MKKIALVITILFFLSSCEKEKKYCGKIVGKFQTEAGYKVRPEPHVQFYCDSLRRNVDVEVTWNSYANATIGKDVCFMLQDYQLKRSKLFSSTRHWVASLHDKKYLYYNTTDGYCFPTIARDVIRGVTRWRYEVGELNGTVDADFKILAFFKKNKPKKEKKERFTSNFFGHCVPYLIPEE